jgi:hypothetical protein
MRFENHSIEFWLLAGETFCFYAFKRWTGGGVACSSIDSGNSHRVKLQDFEIVEEKWILNSIEVG